jgi:hypothetical protein
MKKFINLEEFIKSINKAKMHIENAQKHTQKFIAITLFNKICKN